MDIGYGFQKGENIITKERILSWLHVDEINWYAFLWYISQYCKINDYSEKSFVVCIYSPRQREEVYKKVREYNDEIWMHNYLIDKGNDLYKTHHRMYDENKKVIERLVNE